MSKKVFQKTKAPSLTRRLLTGLGVVVVAVGAGLGLYLSTLDTETFRAPIEQSFKDKTGRTLKLAGPIGWSLSLSDGISLSLADISLGNPAWASRADMARIGKAKLDLALLPLLDKKIDVKAFELVDADIQLETGKGGAANWDFSTATAQQPATTAAAPSASAGKSGAPVAINIRQARITDSRLGLRDENGKVSVFDVPDLTLSVTSKEINLHFNGTLSGIKTELDLNGGTLETFFGESWPFTLEALVDQIKLEATGTLGQQGKKIALASLNVLSGSSNLSGKLDVALGGTRPSLRGEIKSSYLDPADFALPPASEGETGQEGSAAEAQKQGPAPAGSGRMFSREKIDFSGLKAADVDLSLALDKIIMGATDLEKVEGKLTLKGGKLLVQPFAATIGGALAQGDLSLDASASTAQLIASFKTNDMDFSQLFKMGGMESFISGKSSIDISLSSYGQSAYDFAAHANGIVDALMDRGEISQSIMSEVGSGLLQIFAPGVGSISKPGVNCMAARYVITNGLMDTKGLLIDTDMTTVASKGSINLPEETLGLSLFTRPKGLGLGSMIPPMQVAGTLSQPKFTLDATSAVQKITGLITNGSVGSGDQSGVPTLVQVAGKNTCAATLDAPQTAAPTTASPLLPDSAKNAADVVKETGSKLLKGLFGR